MKFLEWRRKGEHWIWLNALAIALCVIMVSGLIGIIMLRGLGYFWPADVVGFTYTNGATNQQWVGEIIEDTQATNLSAERGSQTRRRLKIKIGNRKLNGIDFRWFWHDQIHGQNYPPDLLVLERTEWGNFYGYFQQLVDARGEPGGNYQDFLALLPVVNKLRTRLHKLQKYDIGAVNHSLEKLRLERRKLVLNATDTPANLAKLEARKARLDASYARLETGLQKLERRLQALGSVQLRTADGRQLVLELSKIIRAWQPNSMNLFAKLGSYLHSIYAFVTENPREANTEGGVFPAIFGTVVMVLLMTVFTAPLGVIAAVYMREYAKQGVTIRLVRVCVNNLAGVPSIVYGVFGLGFFVYFLGGNIDRLFYTEALPAPTFGAPGLLWASLTLSLLTLPVVIVSAEEGLARIPISLREGSMALGATKFETIYKVVLPMSSPAIMTGVILAIARAAGEVAPLMLVGVVKLAPDLVVDGIAPYIHLDRKFMHMGFHIFDVGFQSPNVDASTPLVYATSFLLLLVILVLNLAAILVRNRLRERYKHLEV